MQGGSWRGRGWIAGRGLTGASVGRWRRHEPIVICVERRNGRRRYVVVADAALLVMTSFFFFKTLWKKLAVLNGIMFLLLASYVVGHRGGISRSNCRHAFGGLSYVGG
jgi:hypothetical protein